MARLTQLLAFSALVIACAKEPNEVGRHVRRADGPLAPYPPQLTEEESVVVNSFDSVSIDSSSY
jgi:hypothetical protein